MENDPVQEMFVIKKSDPIWKKQEKMWGKAAYDYATRELEKSARAERAWKVVGVAILIVVGYLALALFG